jgi:cytosine/adenosine deaminase-related metal-dependent hydrolase
MVGRFTLVLATLAMIACRTRISGPSYSAGGTRDTAEVVANGGNGASSGSTAEQGREAGQPGIAPGVTGAVECAEREVPTRCRLTGSSRHGVRLLGTLLEPGGVVRRRGTLDLDPHGAIRCAACDCGDAGEALVIDCPGLLVSPGLINLHDHLSYAGTPPLAHPGEQYQHRNDWRLGENGHAALEFAGGATTAQVLAQELRHVMAGTTAIVGAGGRRGLLRNLDMPGLTEGLLPGAVRAETFPLDDTRGSVDGEACRFGPRPDTPDSIETAQAYVAHLGEGTSQRAADELRCALGPLGLAGPNSAIVHAMALSRGDALVLAERGGSVVWSPRSNLDLYGATAPVALLSSLGVRIALGTDWLASGSMSLLRELACVRDYDARVLGGYFDRGQLWRLVTENPAWALGLERRLGELRAGLVGDIAVFSERDDAVAETDDVRLVLRQGAPLYGDAELVSAFDGGIACDQLEVCGRPRRACVGETGLNLGQILEAGEAVYPLWSCTTPEHEPSCSATVSRECPFGENECEAPPLEPDIARRDTDGDGVADHDDTCPRTANPDQADRDADGRGDVCDPCPVPNLGLSPCPVTVAELRAPRTRLPLGSAVLLTRVRVTALRLQGAKGFYLEDGTHAPYSGLFAYTDGKKPDVEPGDIVSVQGYFGAYQGSDELLEVEVLERASGASA